MAKTLVIGGNGFIGSHLVDELVTQGHEVTVFDRFSSPQNIFVSKGVRTLSGEFLNKADLESAVLGQDHVFHFLSTTTPVSAESDPTLDIRTSIAQTVTLLQICANAGVKRFYFASTGGAIYGIQKKIKFDEEDSTKPISPYAIGKLAVENYLEYFRVKHGLESISLRISNPYGPRQKPNKKQGFIPIALRLAKENKQIIRMGDGSMVRDYLFVGDLARAIPLMMDSCPKNVVYNLGSGIGVSVNQVIETIRRITGKAISVVNQPKPTTFVDKVILKTDRFQSEYGPIAHTTLEDGIRQTWESIN